MSLEKKMLAMLLILFSFFSLELLAGGGSYTFVKNADYDESIPTPKSILGFHIGEKPVNYQQLMRYFEVLSRDSRAKLFRYGKTHEGRDLVFLVISSSSNMEQLDQIRQDINRLADPRKISKAEAQKIISRTPAIAWMNYTIHGDELSGTDAALYLAYHLLAGRDSETRELLEKLIICIDPLQNPDGRERFVHQVQIFNGRIENDDNQSLIHTGQWPFGRGNHYYFDLNRDWLGVTQPEGKARVENLLKWNPQMVIDGHEMGSEDTYLFSPPREPFNPFMHPMQFKWWKVFSRDQATAFDSFGWKYYTREWNESIFPGYGTSWPCFHGAIGILYEQAGVEGTAVRQSNGYLLTYEESVHHQFVSSLANLKTIAIHREEILKDFYQYKKDAITVNPGKEITAYLILPDRNSGRLQQFLNILKIQGFELEVSTSAFTLKDFQNYWGISSDKKSARIYQKSKRFPAGTIIIKTAQPLKPFIRNLLDFDIPLSTKFLKDERRELEKYGRSKLYEVTSWSLSLSSGLEIYTTRSELKVTTRPLKNLPLPNGGLVNKGEYGYIFSGESDRAIVAVADLLNQGLKVREMVKETTIEGKFFRPGAFLLLLSENPDSLPELLNRYGKKYGIKVYGINTGLADKGADLGGSYSRLLILPRIALLAGSQVSTTSSGAIWHLLDQILGLKVSLIDINRIGYADLSRYNLIILPEIWGSHGRYIELIGKGGFKRLKEWVRNGGTLIGIGTGAAALADTNISFSQVRLRRQVLKQLKIYLEEYEREKNWESIQVDSLELWGTKIQAKEETQGKSSGNGDLRELKRKERWSLRFRPRGVFLKGRCDQDQWLTFGVKKYIPIFSRTGYVFYSKWPVSTAVRLERKEELRLSGLLWPEARDRLEKSAYLTREGYGRGQLILFAGDPCFRNYLLAEMRLFMNAVVTGPGLGARISATY